MVTGYGSGSQEDERNVRQSVLVHPSRQREERRLTLDELRQLVQRQGGQLDQLPYQLQQPVSADDFPGHFPSVLVNNPAGLWGPAWYQCARDSRYMRLELDDEVRGAAESTRFFPQNWVCRVPSTCADKVRQATDQLYSGDPAIKLKLTKPFRNKERKKKEEDLFTQV